MRLSPSVPHMPGETPESFVSRLARVNRIASARMFCTDLGLSHRAVLNGERDALEHVAELVGMDPKPLVREALTKSNHVWTVRGQTLTGRSMFRDARRVCPACLIADHKNSDLPGSAAAYFRTIWHVPHITACPIHACALVELPKAANSAALRDFAILVEPHLDRLKTLHSLTELAPSSFETYLIGRLEGAPQPSPWLDAMPLYVAAQACEVVGGVAAIGRRIPSGSLGLPKRRLAGDAGFELLSGGPDALARLLEDLRAGAMTKSAKGGPKAWFGDLYEWLRANTNDAAYRPVRDVVLRYVFETKPMRVGERILGETVDDPRFRSIRTVHLDTGIHPNTLRRLLTTAGQIAADEVNSPGKTLIQARATDDLLRRLQGSLVHRDLLAFLGINAHQARTLRAVGLLEPIVAGAAATAGRSRYAIEDVENLLRRLRGEAQETDEPAPGSVGLLNVAKRTNTALDALLGHITAGRLVCTGWSPALPRLRGVFFDLEAARAACRGPELDGFLSYEIQRRLGVSSVAVDALIEAGLLPTERRIHPVKRNPVQIVPAAALERFEATYVKLHELARTAGLHPRAAKAALDQAGVVPALAGGGNVATFYRRADVDLDSRHRRIGS